MQPPLGETILIRSGRSVRVRSIIGEKPEFAIAPSSVAEARETSSLSGSSVSWGGQNKKYFYGEVRSQNFWLPVQHCVPHCSAVCSPVHDQLSRW